MKGKSKEKNKECLEEGLSFEEAIKKLGEIIEVLEENNISLEDAFHKYEDGVKLTNFCLQKINTFEQKVQVLSQQSNGKHKLIPFENDLEVNSEG